MKVDLQITKDGNALLTNVYDVTDADSFANACADLWWKLKQQAARTIPDAGPEHLDDGVLNHLAGAQLNLIRL
jgi:hypothetical protein